VEKKQSQVDLGVVFEGAQQITLAQAVAGFLRFEGENSSWSEETLAWYRERLRQMVELLGGERALGGLVEPDLAEWRARLSERESRYGVSRPETPGGLSAYTLHGHVRAVKRFFGWLAKTGVLQADLARDIKLPKLPRGERKGISDESAELILAASRSSARDYALVSFLESTGVRRGGCEGLLLSDLGLESGSKRLRFRAMVQEKGEQRRPVVMSEATREAMRAWLRERPASERCKVCGVPCEHVFLGRSPGQDWQPLSSVGISEMLDRYKKKLGLRGPCSPHQWRHRWCRRLLENGMPIGHVSQLAGHKDIKITHEFYGAFSIDQLQESYHRFYKPPDTETE